MNKLQQQSVKSYIMQTPLITMVVLRYLVILLMFTVVICNCILTCNINNNFFIL